MLLWLDIHLPPAIGVWIEEKFAIEVRMMRDLGMQTAKDHEVFAAAQSAGAVIMTKDTDFSKLQEGVRDPPRVVLLACGNTSNARLREILDGSLRNALNLLSGGERLVIIQASL